MANKKKAASILEVKQHKPHKYDLLRQLTKAKLMKAVRFINGDGHSLFPRNLLIEKCGWPEETADAVCSEFESDGSGKGDIFDNKGKIIPKLYGWYSLDLLRAIAAAFNITYEGCMGRGFQARKIDEAIRMHFSRKKKELAHA